MSINEAIGIIYDEAARHGEPITYDVAEHIARRLFVPTTLGHLKPGKIAQKHRERYVEEQHG
jgi:hypothetical protein